MIKAISKWQEVDLEFFKEIFMMYWRRNPKTLDNVLEIQTLPSILEDSGRERLFFGAKIDMRDWPTWNKEAIRIFSAAKEVSAFKTSNICLCNLGSGEGPLISPLGSVPGHLDLTMYTYFDGPKTKNLEQVLGMVGDYAQNAPVLASWYFKSDEDYIPGYYVKKWEGHQKYIRLRVWNFETWKNMVNEYLDSDMKFPRYVRKDDVKKKNIKTSIL